MTLEQEEYERGIAALDDLVRRYVRWDYATDELSRFAASAAPVTLHRGGANLIKAYLSARTIQRKPGKYPNPADVVYHPSRPEPNELRHLLLLQIVRLYARLPGRPDPIQPRHIYALFDAASAPRPDRDRVRYALNKLSLK